jgi:phthalate 4,5-dioxygenase
MLSREDNERLSRVGPGTPMGELMRRYWIPACFSNQIPDADGPPIRVRLMGENLVAFRDTNGRVGLLDERCPHRTASLFFGRNEECGIRCVYHGWKFDVEGNCVDMPSEPEGSNFKTKIRIKAYPCLERGGLVWTYMGPAAKQPGFPEIEWAHLPENRRLVTRHIQESNWLQAVEGGFDTSHLAFLHKGTAGDMIRAPEKYEFLETDFGFISGTGRHSAEGARWSTAVFFMPFHKLISRSPVGAHIWVPVDDETTMNYCVDFNPNRPLDKSELDLPDDGNYIHTVNIEGTDRAMQNKDNDYLIDRKLQASGKSYTGVFGLGNQDCFIQESMGPIADRTVEHLGISDTAIIQLRRLLLRALKDVDQGREPMGLNPGSYRIRAVRFQMKDGEDFAAAVAAHSAIPDNAAAAE